jgi:hypothetical protein
MRKIIAILFIAITGLAACNLKGDQIKSFIPGTYVNAAKGEYAWAEDTLVINATGGNAYLITRNTTYQAIRDGRLLRKHHQTQKLNAVFDSQKQELNELTNGRIITFDPNKHLLKVNQAIYHKLY